MSTETETDPFGAGLDAFINPEPVAEVTPPPVVEEKPVVDKPKETVVEKPAEVVETPEDLRAGLLDDKPTEAVEQEEAKEYPPEIRSTKAREHFDALKASKKAAERRAAELETKLKDVEAKSGVASPEVAVLQKQYDELKTKWDEAQKDLAASFLHRTDEFKTAVAKPMEEATTGLNKFAERYKLSTSDIDAALREEDPFTRNELISELAENITGRANQNEFERLMGLFRSAKEKEDELFQNAEGSKEFATKKQEEEQAAARLQTEKQYKDAVQQVIDTTGPKLKELQDMPEVWDSIVKATQSDNLDAMPPKLKAFAVLASNTVLPLLKMAREAKAEVKRLEGVIAARAAASPGAGAGSSSATKKEPTDFVDGLNAFIPR